MNNITVKVENIYKSYGDVEAIKDISFTVNNSEIFGLIGPDGSGKSTIFRIITTLLLADKGNVNLLGFDVIKDYKKIRNMIGYMPGRFSLYQDLSVIENLNFFATVFGTTVDENYDLIKDIYLQIEPFKNRLAGKLSGGMKQKLALSCALIHKPEILVLDEPTTGVDAVSRKEFWEMLRKLKEKNITILVSTPYMDEASLCDRVALIQNGEFLNIDTPDNIIQQFNKKLWSIKTDNMYELRNDLKNYEYTETSFAFGQMLHYTDKRKNVEKTEIEKFLSSKEHSNIKINMIKPNIEDCFMDFMTK
ncbi:MAG: ABC transporter ATP-binding protein [Chlorobi bacterium]|nr:ABC transporter ATP-binding protein [Chlorobiota bacterium]